MEPDFWHGKWQRDETAFHEGKPNERLTRFVNRLKLNPGARVFVPLCGKSADLIWLMDQGFRVAGIELSPIAVTDFFAGLEMTPEVSQVGPLVRHAVPGLVIYQGDVFDLSAEILGEVDAVYDRAALVALPETMREKYAAHLVSITQSAPKLVITFDYDPSSMTGPPFSVDAAQVHVLYERSYAITLLQREPVTDLRTAREAHENVYLLERRSK